MITAAQSLAIEQAHRAFVHAQVAKGVNGEGEGDHNQHAPVMEADGADWDEFDAQVREILGLPPLAGPSFGTMRADLWDFDEDEIERAFNTAQLRHAAGTALGGEWRRMSDYAAALLKKWARGDGPDDPLGEDDFSETQLRTILRDFRDAATANGDSARVARLTPPRAGRGESPQVKLNRLKALLYEDVRTSVRATRAGGDVRPSAKFTLQGPSHRDLDVAVYRDKDGKPRLFRESESGRRGALVGKFDSLDDLAQWADDNGEPRLGDWARAEGGQTAPAKAVKRVPAKKAPAKAAHPDRRVGGAGINPAKARARLVAARTEAEAKAYLDELDMTQAEARALARDLGVGGGRRRPAVGSAGAGRMSLDDAKNAIVANFAAVRDYGDERDSPSVTPAKRVPRAAARIITSDAAFADAYREALAEIRNSGDRDAARRLRRIFDDYDRRRASQASEKTLLRELREMEHPAGGRLADAMTGAGPAPDPDQLKATEVEAIAYLSSAGLASPTGNGWVSGVTIPDSMRRRLDTLAERGWVEKHGSGRDASYRIDPQSIGVRQSPTTGSGALVGDVLPAGAFFRPPGEPVRDPIPQTEIDVRPARPAQALPSSPDPEGRGPANAELEALAARFGGRDAFAHGGGNFLDDVERDLASGLSLSDVADRLNQREKDFVASAPFDAAGRMDPKDEDLARRVNMLELGLRRADPTTKQREAAAADARRKFDEIHATAGVSFHWGTTRGQGAYSDARDRWLRGKDNDEIVVDLRRRADDLERLGREGRLTNDREDMTGVLQHDQQTRDRAAIGDAARLRRLADAILAAGPLNGPVGAPHPEGRGPEGLSADPATRQVQIENRIRAAYNEYPNKYAGKYVLLSELREHPLLRDLPRAEVDAALMRGNRSQLQLATFDNTKALRARDHEGAVDVGGNPRHMVGYYSSGGERVAPQLPLPVDDPSPRPLPSHSPVTPAPALTAAQLRQSDITSARGVADLLSTLDEQADNEASPDLLLSRLRAARDRGVSGDVVDRLERHVREVQVENRIREAFREAPKSSTGEVQLVDLRASLGDLSRDEVDAALIRMGRGRGTDLTPEENQKILTQADRDAAVIGGGGRGYHWLSMQDTSPRALDRAELDRVRADIASEHNLTPTTSAGAMVPFDSTVHQIIDGRAPRKGTLVHVVRPGYELDRAGEKIPLGKATVEVATAEEKASVAPRKAAAPRATARTNTVKVGTRVKLKPSAGSFAATGTVRAVSGEGDDASYEIAAYDDEGRFTVLFLSRKQFTLSRSSEADPDDVERSEADEDLERADLDNLDGDEFEAYWTRGKGLARWLGRPHEWTTLRNLLRKHPAIHDPEGLATKYFHMVKGFYPGADLHRVEHGKPPRGDRIGPG